MCLMPVPGVSQKSLSFILNYMLTLTLAHRTLITRKLKGLEDIISFSSVHWHLGEKGEYIFPNSINA